MDCKVESFHSDIRPWNTTYSYKDADWYISYDVPSNTTALVVPGADGIGVLFLVLNGMHVDEFKEVIQKYEHFNESINGCLGECIRFASQSPYLNTDRCTIGGWHSRLSMTVKEQR